MRGAATAILLAGLALAGCVTGPGDPGPSDVQTAPAIDPFWYEAAIPFGGGHDHTDPDHHRNLSTPNFDVVGWDPVVVQATGTAPGGSSCGAVAHGDGDRRLAAVKAVDSRAVVLVDVADPTQPKTLGELHLFQTIIYDVAVTPDSNYLALVTANPTVRDYDLTTAAAAEWRDACGGRTPLATEDPVPRPVGLLLVDVADPSRPAIVDHRPLTGLGHGVFSTAWQGDTFVLAVTDSGHDATRHFALYEIGAGASGEPRLDLVSLWVSPASQRHAGTFAGHSDGWLYEHPLTGQLIGYFAAATQLHLVDYTDPANPELLASWSNVPSGEPAHVVHSVHTFLHEETGRHYTVVGPENYPMEDTPTGVVWILETSDPRQPEPVAAWTLPTWVEHAELLMFSTHYLTVVDQILYVSLYHGGVWAVGLDGLANGTAEAPTMLSTGGVFVPDLEPPARPDPRYRFPWTPNVEEVHHTADGILVTFDSHTGLYAVRFDATMPIPAPDPWPVDPPPP